MPGRYNLFHLPHKPFRFMWMEVVSTIGTTNHGDEASLDEMQSKVGFAADVYAHHNRDESTWFAPKLRALDAALADEWVASHEGHGHVLELFKEKARSIRHEPDRDARARLLEDFYGFACEFLADDLDHMHMEQTRIMSAFWGAYSDEQLRGLEADFIAERVDPAYLQSLVPLFLRSGNIDNRTFLVGLLQKQVPPPAFEGLLNGLVAKFVPPNELTEIRARLGC